MPNWVITRIIFDNCDDSTFKKITETCKYPHDNEGKLNFNTLIPMDDELDIPFTTLIGDVTKYQRDLLNEYAAKHNLDREKIDIRDIPKKLEKDWKRDLFNNKDFNIDKSKLEEAWDYSIKANVNYLKFGAYCWYDWRINNWGCKWNSKDSWLIKHEGKNGYMVITAWAAPKHVVREISRLFPEANINIEWTDEFLGNEDGYQQYKGGELTNEYYPQTDDEHIEIFCSVHDIDEDDFREKNKLPPTPKKVEPVISDSLSPVEKLREKYPIGSRIVLEKEIDDIHPLYALTRGTVKAVDDFCTIHVVFDNGRQLGIIPDIDSFRALSGDEIISEQLLAYEHKIESIAHDIVDMYKDFDQYDFDDNFGKDEEKALLEIKKQLDSPFSVEKIINEINKMITNETNDKDIIKKGEDLKENLESLKTELNDNLRQKLEEEKDQLNKDVLEIAKNFEADHNNLIEFFNFQSKFHNYSIRNQMLIYKQNPHAIFCASFKQHKNNGYSIKKGEHGMKILVPVTKTYLFLSDGSKINYNSATKQQQNDYRQGKIKGQELRLFKAGYVFDISQTNCPPEDYPKQLDIGYQSQQHKELFNALKEYCENKLHCKVIEDAFSSVSVRGEYNQENHTISISKNFDDTTKLSILTHEMGHAMLHNDFAKIENMTRTQVEFEADAISIMLSKKMGVEVSKSRQEHISNCLTNMKDIPSYSPDMITQSLNKANLAYNDVIRSIDKSLTVDLVKENKQTYTPKYANELENKATMEMDLNF